MKSPDLPQTKQQRRRSVYRSVAEVGVWGGMVGDGRRLIERDGGKGMGQNFSSLQIRSAQKAAPTIDADIFFCSEWGVGLQQPSLFPSTIGAPKPTIL